MSNKQTDYYNETIKELREEPVVCEECGNEVMRKDMKQYPDGYMCGDCHASNEEMEPDYIIANF